jgi:hypothetical protein
MEALCNCSLFLEKRERKGGWEEMGKMMIWKMAVLGEMETQMEIEMKYSV